MKIKQIQIKHFRSIREQTINCDNQTVFIGSNGVGKSTVLKALQAFFNISFKPEKTDFFGHDEGSPIEITLVFHHFTSEEQAEFSSRIHDGELVVTRLFGGENKGSGDYQGMVKGCPDFSSVRGASKAADKKAAYNAIQEKYDLPDWKNQTEAENAMNEWEEKNPNLCQFTKDGGNFFGFKSVGGGKLQRAANFIMVEAVRDVAEDSKDSKVSPIGQIMELIVRSAMKQNEAIVKFQEETSHKYAALTNPTQFPQLGSLEKSLTGSLQEYYKEIGVKLDWQEAAPLALPSPQARINFKEGKLIYPVDRAGNGVQRAFIISLLHQLLLAKTKNEAVNDNPDENGDVEGASALPKGEVLEKLPSVILAIEEPELYQHPTKQWHFAQVLKRLSAGELEETFGDVQVLFCTHSPHFIDLAEFSNVHMVRQELYVDTDIKETKMTRSSVSALSRALEEMWGEEKNSYNDEATKARLHIFGTQLSEGFFADGIILVEGASDKAALEAVSEFMGQSFNRNNIAVLPVHGKANLDRPWAIFTKLGIPTYLVWDSDVNATGEDKKQAVRANKALQNSMGIPTGEIVEFPDVIGVRHACFAVDLNSQLEKDFGDDLIAEMAAVSKAHGMSAQRGRKNPYIIKEVIQNLYKAGKKAPTLEALIVAALKHINSQGEMKKETNESKATAA
jgi:predicted ATPase